MCVCVCVYEHVEKIKEGKKGGREGERGGGEGREKVRGIRTTISRGW